RHLASDHFAGETVDADPVAILQRLAGDRHRALSVVDVKCAAADDADLAHLAANESGVARRAAEGGENSVSRLHAADVLGAGFATTGDDVAVRAALVLVDPLLRLIGVELDPPRRRTRAGVDSLGEQSPFFDRLSLGVRVEDRLEKLIKIIWRNPRCRE